MLMEHYACLGFNPTFYSLLKGIFWQFPEASRIQSLWPGNLKIRS